MGKLSRSRRKTPVFGNAGTSDKWNKRKANRKWRQHNKQRIRKDQMLLKQKEVDNIWAWSKDGKSYWPDAKEKDMRK